MEEYEACNQPRNQFHKLVRPRSLKVATQLVEGGTQLASQTLLPNSGAEKVPVCAQAGSL
jgi:hypothetical protein